MSVLVVGGAGYIGSHMVKQLINSNKDVVVIDSLETGYADAVVDAPLYTFCVSETEKLKQVLSDHAVTEVIHFASFSLVGESVSDPEKYYLNNVGNTLSLIKVLREMGINKFVFSSTAAVFGNPDYSPIDESHPCAPINPYGQSKRMIELALADYASAYGFNSVCLRYFNAAGAAPDGSLGERHDPETHLIPIVLQVASGRREKIAVFGNDYDTDDGTCIRDYVHIEDLCEAHALALSYMDDIEGSHRFNLGNGKGFSIREVIDVARSVTGKPIPSQDEARRPGDPDVLVADATKAKQLLGWKPQYAALSTIIEHAWQWELNHFSSEVES